MTRTVAKGHLRLPAPVHEKAHPDVQVLIFTTNRLVDKKRCQSANALLQPLLEGPSSKHRGFHSRSWAVRSPRLGLVTQCTSFVPVTAGAERAANHCALGSLGSVGCGDETRWYLLAVGECSRMHIVPWYIHIAMTCPACTHHHLYVACAKTCPSPCSALGDCTMTRPTDNTRQFYRIAEHGSIPHSWCILLASSRAPFFRRGAQASPM